MNRGLWLILAALAVIAAVVLFRYDPEPVAAIESSPAPPERTDAVRVSHEFVTVTIPPVTSKRISRPASPRKQTVLATDRSNDSAPRRDVVKASNRTTDSDDRSEPREGNLLERAGRALIGDGKYRPEPFPRIR